MCNAEWADGSCHAMIERYAASTLSVRTEWVRRVLGEGGLSALPAERFYGLEVAPRSTNGRSSNCGRSRAGQREH